jgi:CubicO group peptidase (beta-lactamase class C family)
MFMILNAYRTILAVLLCLIGAVHPAYAAEYEHAEQILAYLENIRIRTGSPGVSAAIMMDGKLRFSGAVGLANLENNSPLTSRSVHSIGSISKTIAVVAVMQLVERNKINLDTEIQMYLPWFPRKEHAVTVRHLLTHTSGLPHYEELTDNVIESVNRFKHYEIFEESTRWWRDQPLLFKPQQYHHYSTFATNLMQGLVESVSGLPFEDYLRQFIWAPAGMLATSLDVQSRVVVGRSRGYSINEETQQVEQGDDEDVSYKYAGGGILSTDEDLVRFGHALNSGKLLNKKTLSEMYRPQLAAGSTYFAKDAEEHCMPTPNWRDVQTGAWCGQALIWTTGKDARGHLYAEHSGGVKSTASYFRNYHERNISIAVHQNGGNGSPGPTDVAIELVQSFVQ